MRGLSLAAIVVLLLGLSVPLSASGGTEHIKDKFTSISWAGSDGSLPWSGPWSEIGDDGDEKKGNVRVVSSGQCASGNCIRLSALTTLLGEIGAVRGADTSDLEELELCFDVKTTDSLLGSELQVQVSAGEGWETVREYHWGAAFSDHPTIDVGDFRSEDFQVRFVFNGTLLAGEAFIDNVEIRGTVVEEETTTTSTSTTTTTTTAPTTTTTAAPTTTTTKPTTTTTTARSETTTSTTAPSVTTTIPAEPATSTGSGDQGREDGSTIGTTTSTSTTTIVEAGTGPGSGSGGDGTTPAGSGIRAATRGLQASFQGDLYGEVRTVSSIAGIDFEADYNMAVEVIEASWGWIVLLGLVVAYSMITGLERRRGEIDT